MPRPSPAAWYFASIICGWHPRDAMFNPVIAIAGIGGASVAGVTVALRWCKPLECADSRADRALCVAQDVVLVVAGLKLILIG